MQRLYVLRRPLESSQLSRLSEEPTEQVTFAELQEHLPGIFYVEARWFLQDMKPSSDAATIMRHMVKQADEANAALFACPCFPGAHKHRDHVLGWWREFGFELAPGLSVWHDIRMPVEGEFDWLHIVTRDPEGGFVEREPDPNFYRKKWNDEIALRFLRRDMNLPAGEGGPLSAVMQAAYERYR